MTTTLIIQYPKPNHLCARVFRQQKGDDGVWRTVGCETVGPDNQITVHQVYGNQRLIIEERAGNYLPSHPLQDKPATDERDEHAEWMKANGPHHATVDPRGRR